MSFDFKQNDLFKYLTSNNIVVKQIDEIEITEPKNIDSNLLDGNSSFEKLLIKNLNKDSTYFKLNPETSTFLQPNGKKVENIILEYSKGKSNIILVELKSKKITGKTILDIKEKFRNSLNWLHLLLSLEHTTENFEVFGIIIAQKKLEWNEVADLDILLSTVVRYKKKSFYTQNKYLTINWSDIIN